VAESRHAAEDAAQLVHLDLDPLPGVVDPEQALCPGAPIIHEKFHTNLIGAFTIGKGDIDAAFARSPHKLQRRFYHHRYAAAPMECRGVVGVHDARTDSVTIWSATQVVHWVRREAAAVLRLPEARGKRGAATVREVHEAITRETGYTTVLVTHDHELANSFADRIVFMKDGRAVL